MRLKSKKKQENKNKDKQQKEQEAVKALPGASFEIRCEEAINY